MESDPAGNFDRDRDLDRIFDPHQSSFDFHFSIKV